MRNPNVKVMKVLFKGEECIFSVEKAVDISIPMHFDGAQPNTYGVPLASAKAYEDGHFVGDTRRGGSVNFEDIYLNPHCNGTHTECVGHISLERISIKEILGNALFPATLMSVEPVPAIHSGESYDPPFQEEDHVITRALLERALANIDAPFLEGLILRTLPNREEKKSCHYKNESTPFFSTEAIQFVAEKNIQHLLVDLPSIDRLFDEGKVSNHHLYWNVSQGSHDVDPENCSQKTITEFVFIPDEVEDGSYWCNIQIPPFMLNAAPSRVFIYRV